MNKHTATQATATSKAGSPSSTMVLAGLTAEAPEAARIEPHKDCWKHFDEGLSAPAGAVNPYYSTSDAGDAWELGKWFASNGKPCPAYLHKSRGYTFIADGIRYRIDCDVVTQIGE